MGFALTVQGRQGIAVQETYDLTGENFYNPYWDTNQSDGTQKKEMQEIEITISPT